MKVAKSFTILDARGSWFLVTCREETKGPSLKPPMHMAQTLRSTLKCLSCALAVAAGCWRPRGGLGGERQRGQLCGDAPAAGLCGR